MFIWDLGVVMCYELAWAFISGMILGQAGQGVKINRGKVGKRTADSPIPGPLFLFRLAPPPCH